MTVNTFHDLLVIIDAHSGQVSNSHSETFIKLEDAIKANTVKFHWKSFLEQLLRLRQICDNPDIALKHQGVCPQCVHNSKRDQAEHAFVELEKPFRIKECGHMFCAEHLKDLNVYLHSFIENEHVDQADPAHSQRQSE